MRKIKTLKRAARPFYAGEPPALRRGATISITENKAFIARYFDALSGKPKPAETVAAYASEEAMQQHVAFFEAAFSHYELFADDMLAEGDKVAVCARFCGTHKGDLMGIAPTGKEVTLPFIIVYQIADGKIAGHPMAIDQMDLMKPLGVMPQLLQNLHSPLIIRVPIVEDRPDLRDGMVQILNHADGYESDGEGAAEQFGVKTAPSQRCQSLPEQVMARTQMIPTL